MMAHRRFHDFFRIVIYLPLNFTARNAVFIHYQKEIMAESADIHQRSSKNSDKRYVQIIILSWKKKVFPFVRGLTLFHAVIIIYLSFSTLIH
jgi:hypothetical protein